MIEEDTYWSGSNELRMKTTYKYDSKGNITEIKGYDPSTIYMWATRAYE